MTLSRHRTSQGEVAYLRAPDGTTRVLLDGRQLAVARPPAAPSPEPPALRERVGHRMVELGLHLLADEREMAA